MKQLFTVDEANATLPYVERVVGEIRECYAALRRNGRLHGDLDQADEKGRAALKERIRHDAQRIRECQEELAQVGVVLKDYQAGLIDFPSEFEGRPIHLCWEHGENRIAYWHEVSEGYFGRRPVPLSTPGWPLTGAPARAGPK